MFDKSITIDDSEINYKNKIQIHHSKVDTSRGTRF